MSLLQATKDLCQMYGIKPARSKGQNFLINEQVYDEIVAAADLQADDIVLEVGPGLGFLTEKLALEAKEVEAVELDDQLAEVLKIKLLAQKLDNVNLINHDILNLNLNDFAWYKRGAYKIVANLPYNISALFLRNFLGASARPQKIVLLLQQEVAERLVAPAGELSLLGVMAQFYSQPKIIKLVPATDFWPQPKISSAIVVFEHDRPTVSDQLSAEEQKQFWRLLKIGFSAKRKQLKNNLMSGWPTDSATATGWLKKIKVSDKIRAQDLSLAQWVALTRNTQHRTHNK